jgi:hypothetical protein
MIEHYKDNSNGCNPDLNAEGVPGVSLFTLFRQTGS